MTKMQRRRNAAVAKGLAATPIGLRHGDDGTLSRLEFLPAIFAALVVIARTELQRAKQGRRK